MRTIPSCASFLGLFLLPTASGGPDLRESGAYGFPQKQATVLCDSSELRVSAWNDRVHLYVQAILFGDGDDRKGETEDGREIGDRSTLLVDCDADLKATPKVDRDYTLNPWPSMPGLHYQVVIDENAHTGLTADSKGRGSIAYLPGADGTRVRVDSYLIPLRELGREPGEKLRIAYWASSIEPELTLNSVGHRTEGKHFPSDLRREDFHEFALAAGDFVLDAASVPEARAVPATKEPRSGPISGPVIGARPPEFAAEEWLHWKGSEAPTLANLGGKVVVVEFWATWCGPCVAGIPHLNELHEKYADAGLVILSLTDQPRRVVDPFLEKRPMKYAVGTGSRTASAYGITGIPQAFVIGRDSRLVWRGHPQDQAFDAILKALLDRK